MTMDRSTIRQVTLELIKVNPGILSSKIRELIDADGKHDRCIYAHNLTYLYRAALVDRVQIKTIAKTYAYTASPEMNQTDRMLEIVKRSPGISMRNIKSYAIEAGIPEDNIASLLSSLTRRNCLHRQKSDANGRMSYCYWIFGNQPGAVIDHVQMTIQPVDAPVVIDRFNMGIDMAAQICEVAAGRPGANPFESEVALDLARRIRSAMA